MPGSVGEMVTADGLTVPGSFENNNLVYLPEAVGPAAIDWVMSSWVEPESTPSPGSVVDQSAPVPSLPSLSPAASLVDTVPGMGNVANPGYAGTTGPANKPAQTAFANGNIPGAQGSVASEAIPDADAVFGLDAVADVVPVTVAPAIANEAAEGASAGADAPTTGSLIGGDIAISHGGGAAIKDLGLAMPNSGAEIEPVANVPQGGGCFAAGMLLSLGDGTAMPIEEFATGGGVNAADQNDPEGPVLVGKVVEVFRHEPQPLMEVEVGGGVIRCTPNHPFYVRGRGFIPAEQLKSGDELRTSSGGWNAVSSVGCRGDVEPVYNIRVAGLHTYFVRVGASDVLVHNKGGGGGNEDPGVLSHGNVAPVSGDDGSTASLTRISILKSRPRCFRRARRMRESSSRRTARFSGFQSRPKARGSRGRLRVSSCWRPKRRTRRRIGGFRNGARIVRQRLRACRGVATGTMSARL